MTVLDTIFRQAEGSRIIANAKRMQENDAALDYGTGFTFIPAGSAEEAADKVQGRITMGYSLPWLLWTVVA